MASAYHHAVSSVRRFGGDLADHMRVHNFFDETSKELVGDFRHRALRHHDAGILECLERLPGIGDGILARIAGQHVVEDHGFVPPLADWLRALEPLPWMLRPILSTDEQCRLSADAWGGDPDDYAPVHEYLDGYHYQNDVSEDLLWALRAMRHHTTGVRECDEIFASSGERALTISTRRRIPVRWVAEKHLTAELGRLYTVGDWLRRIRPARWMNEPRRLSDELDRTAS